MKVIEKLGYTIVPRSEAEKKRGSRRAVLFTEELQSFLSHQTYQFGTEDRFFSGGSIAKAMQTVDQFSAADCMLKTRRSMSFSVPAKAWKRICLTEPVSPLI